MTLGWRWKLLDLVRERFRISVADMTLEQIQASRRSLVPEVPFGAPVLQRIAQQLFGQPRPAVVTRDDTVVGAVGERAARVHRPRHLAPGGPLVVHYHGGGWTTGGPSQYDWFCTSLADDLGATVVSVDYRKAPEDPAPAAADDAIASFRWISEHRDRYDAGEAIAVAGDSAGGNLAALVAIAARDQDLRLDAQVLIYPGVDLTMSFPSIDRLSNEPILPRASIEAFLGHYLSSGEVAPDDPRISPWFVPDVSGLAPALVQTADHDPLVDEGDAYAEKLREAGVEVRHTRYVGVPHGFVSLPGITSAARQATAEAVDFLRRHLGDER